VLGIPLLPQGASCSSSAPLSLFIFFLGHFHLRFVRSSLASRLVSFSFPLMAFSIDYGCRVEDLELRCFHGMALRCFHGIRKKFVLQNNFFRKCKFFHKWNTEQLTLTEELLP